MRLSLTGGNPAEWLALKAGVVPEPAAQAWGGVALSGILVAAVRAGITERLARGPATPAEVAAGLGLDPVPAGLLLEALRSAGHLTRRGGRYRLSRRSRRWLDPGARLPVAGFVAATADYWDWWGRLEETLAGGRPADHHGAPPDDPYWRRYITGQLELARLSAGEVARRLPLPAGARTLLDIGGGHGWYSAKLCDRHPGLTATVLDLPGSAAVGRDIIAAAGYGGRVRHIEADATAGRLGRDWDAVLCFNLIHHLPPERIRVLFRDVYHALAPGGVLAVLDVFADPRRRRVPAQASAVGLFMYLSSGSQVHTPGELEEWFRSAGFPGPRARRVLRLPGQSLWTARKPAA
ncbi:MAG: methyltransferase [Streptosporangiales bacterium]|nr:methyltransferase [Streptosporangiales bacterium]